MSRRRGAAGWRWPVAAVLVLAIAGGAAARSLSEKLGVFAPAGVTITPTILQLQRALARATDFPATTTTPGITFWFDPDSGAYERRPGSLGPAFLERADTVGQGRFDLTLSWLYARFVRFDGESLSDALSSKFLIKSGDLVVPQRVQTRDFSLTSNVIYVSATYGAGPDTDVNLLMPVYATAMRGERRFTSVFAQDTDFQSLDGSAFGPGDLLVRAKHRVWERNQWGVAAGLELHLPTGQEENFQGTGDVLVTPTVVASWVTPALDVHGSLGVYIDASALQQSGVRYGVGASWAVRAPVTLVVDVVGTSDFSAEDISFFVPDRRLVSVRGEFDPPLEARAVGAGTEFTTVLARQDVVDAAFAVKVHLHRNLIGYLGVIVPLTSDGARAAAMPTGGIQYGF